jgi:hypothetical protein
MTQIQVFIFFMAIIIGLCEPSVLFHYCGLKSLPFVFGIVFSWELPENFLHLPEQQWVSEINHIHRDECQVNEIEYNAFKLMPGYTNT